MDALGAYGSESESEREAGDRDAGDDDAFVGPARPPPRVVGKPPVDDEEDARRDDVVFVGVGHAAQRVDDADLDHEFVRRAQRRAGRRAPPARPWVLQRVRRSPR